MKRLMMLVAALMSGLMTFAQSRDALVTNPADAIIETWHVDGANSSFYLYYIEWYNYTGDMATLSVIVNGNWVPPSTTTSSISWATTATA